ncbi:MAG: hypothetical protein R2815_03660 [Flavobacteriales bacterium]
MGTKRFHTRRQWNNTLLVLWVVPFILLTGAISVGATDGFLTLIILSALSLVAIVVGVVRDASTRAVYAIESDRLALRDGKGEEIIGADRIIDASLIDRMAAREYIRASIGGLRNGGAPGAARAKVKEMTRFCSVDLGLTTFTFGMGRRLIDNMPRSKDDLVLLRLHEGKEYFLSPLYNQDLVDNVSRLIRNNS